MAWVSADIYIVQDNKFSILYIVSMHPTQPYTIQYLSLLQTFLLHLNEIAPYLEKDFALLILFLENLLKWQS
jgi:hypothetical protein